MRALNRHRIWQAAVDAALIAAAWYLAFALRFDYGIPPRYERLLTETIAVVVGVKIAVFVLFRLYDHWWRYLSIRDMWAVARAVTAASLLAEIFVYLLDPEQGLRVPRSIVIFDWLILLALVMGARLLARTVIERPGRRGIVARGKEALIVGAGDAGQLVIREMRKSPNLGYTPIGLVDDDPRKRNMRLHGVRVLGTTRDLPHILGDNRPDEVIIAIPSAGGEARQRVVNVCRDAGVAVKTLPAVHELITGDLNLARQLREVQVEDVLGREAVELDVAAIASYLTGSTVLVTGAGGSIGSELCRQIAALGAERIVLVDHSENALVDIERELAHERHFDATLAVLADVTNRAKMRELFERHRPSVVFHAAAYKHVPLMEGNPLESVRNNVIGTRVLAEVASEFGADRFVLVSTDKAVRPQNVLGQTKAVCEWIVQAAGTREANGTRFISVRFGNVLGSSGSVIPLFRRQIVRGGPVTVTHPDMERYFMTIPEAVQLVVQAGALGETSDIFVLDMGTPVKIVDLARNMIRLSGKEPDRDIPIEFIGVRAGEKLHEELWGEGEEAVPTSHPKILRCASRPVDPVWLEEELAELERLAEAGETLDIVARLVAMVGSPQRLGAPAAEQV
ncbi:MAG TPA: nucleoside-diphosphate sugar epimerase/dehydratase [Gaiellaceae bacterium]|nr:nucleoside-diphosphate sugar epimerase/dehydratase [Gaiellaceae bacterium]